ncbi:MAG TPA: stage III sporulation protein AF [Clostridiales bacterium]|nr:stage III sporulation protein AF [Clostridiales bacterium]
MSAVKEWAFSLCAAMVAAGLLRMLLPKSNLEKILRMVLSVFFLCCLLSPAVLKFPSLLVEMEMESREELTSRSEKVMELARRQSVELARESLKKLVKEKLAQRGIIVHAVTINMVTQGQNDMTLQSVELVLDAAEQQGHDDLALELGRELGTEVIIRYQ